MSFSRFGRELDTVANSVAVCRWLRSGWEEGGGNGFGFVLGLAGSSVCLVAAALSRFISCFSSYFFFSALRAVASEVCIAALTSGRISDSTRLCVHINE